AQSGPFQGTTMLTVTATPVVSISVTPINPQVPKGSNQQFAATATFQDNSTKDITTSATWNSSNTGFATISNASGSQGLATTLNQGSTMISASYNTISGNTMLTVAPHALLSIAITPPAADIPPSQS